MTSIEELFNPSTEITEEFLDEILSKSPATKVSIASNSAVAAPSWNFPVSMNANDTFELMWAADSTNVSLSASAASSFHPEIPSAILTVTQINL